MTINKQLVGTIARVVVGLVFILSALLKYLSIDAVDLFFFEHKILSLTSVSIVSRLLISFEFLLGVFLILGFYPRVIRFLTYITLIGFTIYILLKPYLFTLAQENCYCFGDNIMLNDTQTIIKNIVLLSLTPLSIWSKGIKSKYNGLVIIGLSIVVLISAYTIKSPDFIYTKLYGTKATIKVDNFNKLLDNQKVALLKPKQGKKVICLYSTGCKYCVNMAKKVEVIINRHNLSRDNFIEIFWGNENNLNSFYQRSHSNKLSYIFVDPILFLNATKGKQPIVVLINNGVVEEVYKYNTIKEYEIVDFLK